GRLRRVPGSLRAGGGRATAKLPAAGAPARRAGLPGGHHGHARSRRQRRHLHQLRRRGPRDRHLGPDRGARRAGGRRRELDGGRRRGLGGSRGAAARCRPRSARTVRAGSRRRDPSAAGLPALDAQALGSGGLPELLSQVVPGHQAGGVRRAPGACPRQPGSPWALEGLRAHDPHLARAGGSEDHRGHRPGGRRDGQRGSRLAGPGGGGRVGRGAAGRGGGDGPGGGPLPAGAGAGGDGRRRYPGPGRGRACL
ncbi:MAG: Beta-ketoadipate enol-lactone hydrolase, partial [uncultured Nocardioidaceae bacterium]